MNSKFILKNYDVVFLSYDEPNADRNYQHLLTIIPYAKRVHAVKGSDSAHKACAKISNTDRVIIIDGDNHLIESPVNQIVEISDIENPKKIVLSWASKNIINGLSYGNGGIKCWDTQQLLDNKTHENSDPFDVKNQIDFCWDLNYIAIDKNYSVIYNNGSRLQAFRAGFREGVKLMLEQGCRVENFIPKSRGNLFRLKAWLSTGKHVENGIWAIYGAWHGLYNVCNVNWDITNVRNFDYLNKYFYTNIDSVADDQIHENIALLKEHVPNYYKMIPIFSSEDSENIANNQSNPIRQKDTVKIYYE